MAFMTNVVNLICAVVLVCALRWPAIAGLFCASGRRACYLFRPRGTLRNAWASGRRLPAVRQQFVDATVELGRQAREHILELRPGVGLVELGRLQLY